jgi:hypothetical protein
MEFLFDIPEYTHGYIDLEFGCTSVDCVGQILILLEDARGPQGTNQEDAYYTAQAVDLDGNRFIIRWETNDDYSPLNEDEGDACDWDKFTVLNADGSGTSFDVTDAEADEIESNREEFGIALTNRDRDDFLEIQLQK